MTVVVPAASPQAVVDAALLLLDRMGLSPEDLLAVPRIPVDSRADPSEPGSKRPSASSRGSPAVRTRYEPGGSGDK
jgi:hypothetical protein